MTTFGSARCLFLGGEMAAVDRIDAEERQEVRRHGRHIDALGFAAGPRQRASRADDLPAGPGGQHLERSVALLIVAKVAWRHRRQRLRADAEVDPEVREPIRCAIGQRPHQHAVDDGEDRRRGANAEAQSEDGERGEARAPAERSPRVSDVLAHGGHAPRLYQSECGGGSLCDEGWDRPSHPGQPQLPKKPTPKASGGEVAATFTQLVRGDLFGRWPFWRLGVCRRSFCPS